MSRESGPSGPKSNAEQVAQLKREREALVKARDEVQGILDECKTRRVDIAKSPTLSLLPGKITYLNNRIESCERAIGSYTIMPDFTLDQMANLGAVMAATGMELSLSEMEAIDAKVRGIGRMVATAPMPKRGS